MRREGFGLAGQRAGISQGFKAKGQKFRALCLATSSFPITCKLPGRTCLCSVIPKTEMVIFRSSLLPSFLPLPSFPPFLPSFFLSLSLPPPSPPSLRSYPLLMLKEVHWLRLHFLSFPVLARCLAENTCSVFINEQKHQ